VAAGRIGVGSAATLAAGLAGAAFLLGGPVDGGWHVALSGTPAEALKIQDYYAAGRTDVKRGEYFDTREFSLLRGYYPDLARLADCSVPHGGTRLAHLPAGGVRNYMKAASLLFLSLGTLLAQVPNPTQRPENRSPSAETRQPTPIFRVTVVSRTTKAINYQHRNGTTKIDFRGTELMPSAKGDASVDSRLGSTKVSTHLDHMTPASQFGSEYMTYVLWAVTPEGRATNLGEVVLEGDHANLLSTTDLQSFGLIVTAEPYFAVTQPSDVVVAENFVRGDTTGTIEQVDAKFELLQRGQYVFNRSAYQPVRIDPKGPLQLSEAENAVEIARLAGAERYATDTFQKAKIDLDNARNFLTLSHDRKRSETNAREAAQMAEDARIITIRKISDEQLAAERAAAAQREADAKAKAEQSAEQARLDAQRRSEAEAARQAAETAAKRAAEERASAEAARVAALEQQKTSQAEAQRADRARLDAEQARQQAEAEKTQLRERLRQQLNLILETRETARGLIVNISDVLFDFDKYTLKPDAREKMAKVSGILLAYPGLKIQLEGHTDSIGTDDYNLKLSDRRANAVRDYLTQQGVSAGSVTAAGLGKADPVASNDTASGRQRNRRVDMVVSGGPIGIDPTEP
jgi:outer membrane protein OmpA-like peptidoglycan-associated protein